MSLAVKYILVEKLERTFLTMTVMEFMDLLLPKNLMKINTVLKKTQRAKDLELQSLEILQELIFRFQKNTSMCP